MEPEIICVPQSGNHTTHLYFSPTNNEEIHGNILILHGMAEHHERYMEFIQLLNSEGFDVYAYDHRGHGKATPTTDLGYFAKKDGAAAVVGDAIAICNYIKESARTPKLAVFGHSMGSLILRNVIQQLDTMDCVIICGTTMPPAAMTNAGLKLANMLSFVLGPKRPSPLLNKILFESEDYTKICTRTKSDWLTRDEAIVDKYIEDPYCGFICTTSMYRDLVQFTKNASTPELIQKTRKDLPLYFIAGEQDPVGGFGSQVTELYHLFGSLGFTDTAIKLYPEDRHEILNEFDKETVMQDCVAFFHKHLG